MKSGVGNEEAISNSPKGYAIVSRGLWGVSAFPVNVTRALSGFMERVSLALPLPSSVSGDFCPWSKRRSRFKVQREMFISYGFGWLFVGKSVVFLPAAPEGILEIWVSIFSGKYFQFSLFCPYQSVPECDCPGYGPLSAPLHLQPQQEERRTNLKLFTIISCP